MAPGFLRRLRRKAGGGDERGARGAADAAAGASYFGDPDAPAGRRDRPAAAPAPRARGAAREHGEQVLLTFIRARLGGRAEALAVRLMNKAPLKGGTHFVYCVNQGTEETDVAIVRRDLLSGRLYRSGVRLHGGAWCPLLLGDRFAVGGGGGGGGRQVHELVYRRSACSCLTCLARAAGGCGGGSGGDAASEASAASGVSLRSSYTSENSAMANFVQNWALPPLRELELLALSAEARELEMGTIVRLNSRASSKFKFTPDFKALFCHLAYTGPISHEDVYRKVTTIGVNYYMYNKGKKDRKVYLRGQLLQIPIEIGVVKLGARPLRTDELGCLYLVHRKQVVQIYIGEVVLEGNSIGSFIHTGLKFYVGFGEEGGCSALYPNRKLGVPRTLGVNELLLHHNMVDDLEVRMR